MSRMATRVNVDPNAVWLCFECVWVLVTALMLTGWGLIHAEVAGEPLKDNLAKPISSAVSTGTGLLLEPASILPEFNALKFYVVPIVWDSPQLESRRA